MEGPPYIRRYEMATRATEAKISAEAYRSRVNPHIREYAGKLASKTYNGWEFNRPPQPPIQAQGVAEQPETPENA